MKLIHTRQKSANRKSNWLCGDGIAAEFDKAGHRIVKSGSRNTQRKRACPVR